MQTLPLARLPLVSLPNARNASGEATPWCLPPGSATRSFAPCKKKSRESARKRCLVQSTLSAKESSVLSVREAESPSDLFACSWLRAHCFCKFPRLCAPDIQQVRTLRPPIGACGRIRLLEGSFLAPSHLLCEPTRSPAG